VISIVRCESLFIVVVCERVCNGDDAPSCVGWVGGVQIVVGDFKACFSCFFVFVLFILVDFYFDIDVLVASEAAFLGISSR